MRFEYKYVVPMERLDALRRDIIPYTTLDAYTLRRKDHQYTVRSIYFDTSRLAAYREKLEGIKNRKKLRVRSYNIAAEDAMVFLEIKTKVEQRGMKYRSALSANDLPAFLQTKCPEEYMLDLPNRSLALDNARRFLFHYVRSAMRPVVLVTYEREAFQGQFDPNLRITFDKHLRFQGLPSLDDLYIENGLTHLAPSSFIMELKFGGGFAPWLRAIVRKHGLTRVSVSKYGSCVTASGVAGMMGCAYLIGRSEASLAPDRTEVAA
ncbi:MAG: polyphosphate polymerase domain-containing protein [Bacteroidetes bacterium]|nr:polyphosphate polymerase domain-containing protein [Bacteroidota bacterium]MCW5896466.1 polyphosphate polymerase domain-containing protein [Bacteroidota bacterium]